MYKVMTIVGTRPELIKLSILIKELDKYSDHILVHTGQNYDYELNEIFFKDLSIRKPDYFLNTGSKTAIKTISKVIEKSEDIMLKEKPDALVIYGDTNSCLSVISAKRNKIPIFHMEAGNRCFDLRVPEEINRKIVDHLSDINFVLTEHARRYLEAEGINKNMIIKTGSHMLEVLNKFKSQYLKSKVLKTLKLSKRRYFLFSIHREENVDDKDNLALILEAMNSLIDIYRLPVIVSTHPRTKEKLSKIRKKYKNYDKIKFLKPFGFFDYIHLQTNALCVVSDSGTITEESSILGFPAITIRNMHERPEGMDEGILIMSGLKVSNVLDSIKVTIDLFKRKIKINSVHDYNSENSSIKIVKAIYSYIEYVNKNVWKK